MTFSAVFHGLHPRLRLVSPPHINYRMRCLSLLIMAHMGLRCAPVSFRSPGALDTEWDILPNQVMFSMISCRRPRYPGMSSIGHVSCLDRFPVCLLKEGLDFSRIRNRLYLCAIADGVPYYIVLLSSTPPQAIEDSILEWVNLLHMRTPLCTVMLVGSHFDMLRGATHQDNDQLLATVEARYVYPKPPYARQTRHGRSPYFLGSVGTNLLGDRRCVWGVYGSLYPPFGEGERERLPR